MRKQYFRIFAKIGQNLMHVIQRFSPNWSLLSHVADKFCLFERNLRNSKHFFITVYFRKPFSRDCKIGFRKNITKIIVSTPEMSYLFTAGISAEPLSYLYIRTEA